MPKLAFDIGVTSLGAGSVTFLVCVLAFARVGNIVAGQPGFDTQAGTTLEFTATQRTPTSWELDDISPLRPLPSRLGCLAALRNRCLVVEMVQWMGGRVDEGGSLENCCTLAGTPGSNPGPSASLCLGAEERPAACTPACPRSG